MEKTWGHTYTFYSKAGKKCKKKEKIRNKPVGIWCSPIIVYYPEMQPLLGDKVTSQLEIRTL